MEPTGREKQRAANIIWNACGDYSFRPDYEVYDMDGKADLYWNFIVGAVRRYYDYSHLNHLFADLQVDRDHEFYERLAWLGLESCTFLRAKKDRPVLEELRRSYALRVLRKEEPPSMYFLVDDLKHAHFHRALGAEPVMSEQVAAVLNALEFDETPDTEQIVRGLRQLFTDYFPLGPASQKRSSLKYRLPAWFTPRSKGGFSLPWSSRLAGTALFPFFNSAEADEVGSPAQSGRHEKRPSHWRRLRQQVDEKQKENVQSLYGVSILSEVQTQALEKILCVGSHQGCRLYFTRGEFDASTLLKANGKNPSDAAASQAQKNRKHYQMNLARNTTSIARLTSLIKNTLLVYLEPSTYRSKAGRLAAGKVWRNVYMSDDKVFTKTVVDDVGSLSVDILLDASGSQIDRQEMIASQGYIIAESLHRCRIPVREYSFCTKGAYTILNLFREYGEDHANERIFNYRASGCNRDGLAIRTVLHRMDESRCDHKFLIVLSDGKPVDPRGVANHRGSPDLNFYADSLGVNDTALEVRKGRQNGVSILCVYTGMDDDLPAAQKIYGSDLVRIKSPEKFADMVGILITNQLRNR